PEHIPPPPSLSAHVGTVRISTQTAIQPIDIHLSQKGLITEVVKYEVEGNAWVQCHSGLTHLHYVWQYAKLCEVAVEAAVSQLWHLLVPCHKLNCGMPNSTCTDYADYVLSSVSMSQLELL
ncbi:uncharacterized, partial [Tachysurus ichikawai]